MTEKKQEEKILSPEFLEEIKKTRMEKGLSTLEVAEKTNIKESYIIAIEDGNLSKLPGGVYNKAYIRSISEYLNVSMKPYEKTVSEEEAKESTKIKLELGRVEATGELTPNKSILIITILFITLFSIIFAKILIENDDDAFIENKNRASKEISANDNDKERGIISNLSNINSEVNKILPKTLKAGLFASSNLKLIIQRKTTNEYESFEESQMVKKEGFLKKGQILFLDSKYEHIIETEDFSEVRLFINGVEINNFKTIINDKNQMIVSNKTLYGLFKGEYIDKVASDTKSYEESKENDNSN